MDTTKDPKFNLKKNFKKLCIMNVDKSEANIINLRLLCSECGEFEQFEHVAHKNLAFTLYKSES